MSFEYEAAQIPHLLDTAIELKEYAESLGQNIVFEKKSNRWVSEPNFVTFTIQSARAKQLAVTVQGLPESHLNYKLIDVKKDRPPYSIFRVSDNNQIEEAKDCIRRAAVLKGVY